MMEYGYHVSIIFFVHVQWFSINIYMIKPLLTSVSVFEMKLTLAPWSLSCSCRGMHCQSAYIYHHFDKGLEHTLLFQSHSAHRCTGKDNCRRTLANRRAEEGEQWQNFIMYSGLSVQCSHFCASATCACSLTHTQSQTQAHTYTNAHARIHTHMHVHTRTCTYTHTHTNALQTALPW